MEFQAVGFAEHKEKKEKEKPLPAIHLKIPFVRDFRPYYAYYLGAPLVTSLYRYTTKQFRVVAGLTIALLVLMRLSMML